MQQMKAGVHNNRSSFQDFQFYGRGLCTFPTGVFPVFLAFEFLFGLGHILTSVFLNCDSETRLVIDP